MYKPTESQAREWREQAADMSHEDLRCAINGLATFIDRIERTVDGRYTAAHKDLAANRSRLDHLRAERAARVVDFFVASDRPCPTLDGLF